VWLCCPQARHDAGKCSEYRRRWSIDIARIRTIKPEAFASESLAMVSLSAERTFFGLLTLADDRGHFRDQAAVIAGLLWSLRPDHGPLQHTQWRSADSFGGPPFSMQVRRLQVLARSIY
jgi:hypothetical protein